MGATTDSPAADAADAAERFGWRDLLKRLAIWAGFFALLYLARDFFFVAFMTLLFCYLTLAAVERAMRWLSPRRDRPWLRPALALALLLLTPLVLLAAGALVAPRVIDQAQRLAGWLSQVTPEAEASRLLEGVVGPRLFHQKYGGPVSEAYQEGLAAFRQQGARHVRAYQDFPHLE